MHDLAVGRTHRLEALLRTAFPDLVGYLASEAPQRFTPPLSVATDVETDASAMRTRGVTLHNGLGEFLQRGQRVTPRADEQTEIVPLDEVRQREAGSMKVRIALDGFFEDTLPHLRELLEHHRGECEIEFELAREDFKVVFRPHPFLRVEPSPDLVTSLEAMCGEGSVELSRDRLPSLD